MRFLLHAIKSISDLINTFQDLLILTLLTQKQLCPTWVWHSWELAYAAVKTERQKQPEKAISNPLLDNITIRGAKGHSHKHNSKQFLSLIDVEKATEFIQREAHEDANIIFGAAIDESLGENLQITVIATGFENTQADKNDYIREVKSDIIVQRLAEEDEQPLQNDPVTAGKCH